MGVADLPQHFTGETNFSNPLTVHNYRVIDVEISTNQNVCCRIAGQVLSPHPLGLLNGRKQGDSNRRPEGQETVLVPGLTRLALIVRAADVKGQENVAPEGVGLRLAALGISDEERLTSRPHSAAPASYSPIGRTSFPCRARI
jgi:hypothetical protein